MELVNTVKLVELNIDSKNISSLLLSDNPNLNQLSVDLMPIPKNHNLPKQNISLQVHNCPKNKFYQI